MGEAEVGRLSGLWRVKEVVARGFYQPLQASHYHFSEGRLRRFRHSTVFDTIDEVDSGRLSATGGAELGTMDFTPDATTREWVFRFVEDRLEIGYASKGGRPTEISSKTGEVVRLLRDPMPVPPVRIEPVRGSFTHPYFGPLSYDARIGSWEGTTSLRDRAVELTFHAGRDDSEPKGALEAGERVCRDLAGWCTRAEQLAVDSLLSIKNDEWLIEEGEEPIGAEEFRARMRLDGISFAVDGSFAFEYDDGEIFHGHVIMVSGTAEGLTEATIEG